MTGSHALVTGGAGFIGTRLARRLLAEGRQVTIIDNLSVGGRDAVPEGARFVHGDIRDAHAVADADVDDIVAGTMATPGRTPGTYNLGTGRGTSVNRLSAMLIRPVQNKCDNSLMRWRDWPTNAQSAATSTTSRSARRSEQRTQASRPGSIHLAR